MQLEPSEYLEALRAEADAFIAAVVGAPHARVPSCPEWDVTDLALHLGNTWQWAVAIVERGGRADRVELPDLSSEDALVAWMRERADEVESTLDRLAVADPDHDCWTFGLPRARRFWVRRMALETLLHAWDARDAAGNPSPMDSRLAADGVDEFLSVMLPRSLQRHPGTWNGETVHLHRTDGDGEWWIILEHGEVEVEAGHKKADVAVRGPGSALYLWVTGRRTAHDLDELDVVGDRAVATRWTVDIRF